MKCLLRDRSTLFWTLLFPLLLSTLFFVAFGHLHSDQDIVFDPIPVAVVDNEAYAGGYAAPGNAVRRIFAPG